MSCSRACPVSGRGPGARILAEIGDGQRFVDGDHRAVRYAGLAPVTRQSGKSINGETKSRRGNHRLKNAMFLAAFASLRSPESKAFYDRKRAEGKRHNAGRHLPRPPALQRHPGHAPGPPALPCGLPALGPSWNWRLDDEKSLTIKGLTRRWDHPPCYQPNKVPVADLRQRGKDAEGGFYGPRHCDQPLHRRDIYLPA